MSQLKESHRSHQFVIDLTSKVYLFSGESLWEMEAEMTFKRMYGAVKM